MVFVFNMHIPPYVWRLDALFNSSFLKNLSVGAAIGRPHLQKSEVF